MSLFDRGRLFHAVESATDKAFEPMHEGSCTWYVIQSQSSRTQGGAYSDTGVTMSEMYSGVFLVTTECMVKQCIRDALFNRCSLIMNIYNLVKNLFTVLFFVSLFFCQFGKLIIQL